MSFYADYTILGDGEFANEQIDFNNTSMIGQVVDSENLEVDGISKSTLTLSDYTVTKITKYQWSLGDGNYYYDENISHKFIKPGKVLVKLSVWSENFSYSGSTFQFKYSLTKEVTVQSRFYKFLTDNYPTWDLIKNPQIDTLFQVAGSFFDKLHSKITDLYNLSSIDKIDPLYFDVLAQTLGHDVYYRKIGYTLDKGDFSKYDIIDKIASNIATTDELNSFRQFLSRSSDIFKKKGTPQDVMKFLEFFSIDGQPVDLWTLNFGKTTKGTIEETFTTQSFDDNKLSLAWDNVKIVGNVNDLGHLIKNDGSIIIDSYYKVQKYEQDSDVFSLAPVVNRKHESWDIYEIPRYIKSVRYGDDNFYTPVEMWKTPNEISDLVAELYVTTPWQVLDLEAEQQRIVFDTTKTSTVSISGNGGCTTSFSETTNEVKYIHSSIIRDIRLNNGSEIADFTEKNDINPYLVDWRSVSLSGSSIVVDISGLDLDNYFTYYPHIQLQNFLEVDHAIEQGQRMSVSYLVANEDAVESSIVTVNEPIKNFDASASFMFKSPEQLTYNKKIPDNQFHIIFRGTNSDKNEKYAISEYYKATICGIDTTFSVSKVVTNSDGSIIQQKINLTGDRNNIVFDKLIKEYDSVENFEFVYNTLYELKVSVTNSFVSVWIRRLPIDTQLISDIQMGIGNNNYGKNNEDSLWMPLIENLNMDVGQENVTSYNIKNQVINNTPYVYYGESGAIGFGSKNTILFVNKLTVNNMDLDTTLYTDIEKQIYLKPKYLEWQKQRDIILSSYDNTVPYYDQLITKNFNSATQQFTLTNEQASSLHSIYFNDVDINDELASRYTIWFDKQWLQQNYIKNEKFDTSFYEKIVIPFGSQYTPFLSENTVFNKEVYHDIHGGTSGSVGLFIANNSPILDTYDTVPYDSFSSLTRISNTFYFNEKIKQYSESGREPIVTGIYEEIIPFSNIFTEINGQIILNDKSTFRNRFFNPVIVDTECGKRTIGVRFRNCKDILTTIKRYATELSSEVHLYGSFTFHVPSYSVKYAPHSNFEISELYEDYVKFNVFSPLGILNEKIKVYTLGKSFIKEHGGMIIELNGIYVKLSSDHISNSSNTTQSLTIKNQNPYEDKYNELYCKYWLSATLDFNSPVYRDSEPDFSTSKDGVNFFLSNDVRKLLSSLESSSNELSGDYNWWIPSSDIYRKRDFDIITVDLSNDIITNLNYYGYDGNPIVDCSEQRDRASTKILYGNKVGGFEFSSEQSVQSNTQCVTAIEPLKALQIRLTDGNSNITPNTTYYAKLTVRMNYSGFDQRDIDVLQENEKMKLKILGTNKKEIFKKAPVVKCYTMYVPFSWYDTNHTPSNNIIEYANFIRGSYGHGDSPNITLAPFGLMTELLNNMDIVDKQNINISENDFTEWNKYILDNMSVDAIYEQIPSSVYKLYKNYGIFNKLDLNIGSYVQIDYNKADQIEWDVIENFKYFFDGSSENFFELPNQINTMISWVNNVRSIKLNNYEVSNNLYNITENNNLILNGDTFSYFNSSEMYSKHMLNLYLDVFNTSQNNFTFEEYVQNFNTNNQISFIPYESTTVTPFRIVERTPSENLIFNSSDELYTVINVGGYQAMKVNINNTQIRTAYGKVGSSNNLNDINLNLSEMSDVNKLFMIDEDSPVFDMESLVYFDEQLDKIGDYRGKKFEFVIKGNTTYNTSSENYNLSEYYFVGIGTYEFDVGLGIAKYDSITDTLNKSFLVGFGDYNTKNLKSKTWYKLRVIATSDYIRVIFNEKDKPERLVINYNVSPQNNDLTGINEGNYEELVYMVKGLNNLDVTYLNNISKKTGSEFVSGNVNLALAASKRPSGYLSGISIFNEYTYVTNIVYRIQKPKLRSFSNVSDCVDITDFITYIKQNFGEFGIVKFVGKTLNNTIVIHVDDILYYSDKNKLPVKYIDSGVVKTSIYQNMVIVVKTLNNTSNLMVIPETFKNEYNIFIKDNNFNVDHIYRYLTYTNRQINNVYTDNDQISIVMS
jgi:hypothetical protein